MLVKVAIDLSLDRLFFYEVPAAFQGKLAIGQLLSVPFGHQLKRGFALELGDWPAARAHALKPVAGIVDPEPFFSPQLLTLVRQIAAYTASPIESVLRSAVPAAVVRPNARPRELLFVEPALAARPVLEEEQLRGACLAHLVEHFLECVAACKKQQQHGNVYLGGVSLHSPFCL